MNRRSFLTSTLATAGVVHSAAQTGPGEPARRLKCKADGTFKVLMISDQHYVPTPDRYGIELTEKLIAAEKPDVVFAVGDCMSGDTCFSPEDVQKTAANVGEAMEKAHVPWAIAFGNHDQEHFARTHLDKAQVLAYYERYPYNVNGGWVRGLHGAGNKNFLVWNAAGTKPVFNLWLVDSGDYTKNRKDDRYDWIRPDQIHWYCETSKRLEKEYGQKIPSLMFFHIALPEFGVAATSRKIVGERHEPESPSNVNSGLFAAALDREDVKGIYCGHDHVNNYVTRWKGIDLGFDGVVGFKGYPHTPPEDITNNRARGGRAFLITEADPWHYKTWMRFKDGTTNWESWSGSYFRDQIK
jgi:hypothetical protein